MVIEQMRAETATGDTSSNRYSNYRYRFIQFFREEVKLS